MSDDNDPGSEPKRRQFLQMTAGAGIINPLMIGRKGANAEDEYASDFEIRPFSAKAPDDVTLNGHVYLPEDEDPPYGTVLYWSPYWNTVAATPSDDPPAEDGNPAETVHGFGGLHRLVREGFAVAAVNSRGTGISEGCFQWLSPVEYADGYVIVEELADKEWSNGKVGMYGLSYDGASQVAAMAASPPSLEAIVPVDPPLDLWTLFTRQGATRNIGPVFTPAWDIMVSLGSANHEPDRVDCPRRLRDWTVNGDLVISGDKNGWFEKRDLTERLSESRIPMFATLGIKREAGGATNALQYRGVWEARPPQTTRLLLGQWGHAFPKSDGRAASPEFKDEVVQWFDHYLRDGPKRVKTGVVEYQDDTGSWHTSDSWPPTEDRTSLYLSDRTLESMEEGVQASQQTFQSNDTNPGVSPEQCGPRQAVYVSPPLEESVRIAGNFTISTTVTSTLSGGHFAAFLYKTAGDGSCPDPRAEEFARCLADLRHWKTLGRARPFPVGTPTEVSFKSHPCATELPAGDRVVLAIGGGSPELMPSEFKPVLTVSTGEGFSGVIDLPVVEGSLSFPST